MTKRLFYEAPEAELFVVRFEENILSDPAQLNGRKSGGVGDAGYNGSDFEGTSYDML